jgi:hypothetical protein
LEGTLAIVEDVGNGRQHLWMGYQVFTGPVGVFRDRVSNTDDAVFSLVVAADRIAIVSFTSSHKFVDRQAGCFGK